MSDRPLVTYENGTWSYRLSGWGGCIRNLVAARKGITPIPQVEDTILGEGHLHEGDVVERLRKEGFVVTNQQREVVVELVGGRVVGHLDGEVDAKRILEVKALGKNTFSEAEAIGVKKYVEKNVPYAWQISGGMLVTGLPAHYAIKSRDSGKILHDIIEEPFYDLEDFQARLDEIEKWIEVDRLPPCEKTGFCWKGPYRHIHYKESEPEQPIPIHHGKDEVIEELAEKLYEARQMKRMYETREDELKEEILSMTDPGVYLTDKHEVKVVEVETTRMDQKAVRAEHGDRYDVRVKYPRVTVNPRG